MDPELEDALPVTKHFIFEDTEKKKRASELWVTLTKNKEQTRLTFQVDVKWRAMGGSPLPPHLIFAASRNHTNDSLRHKSFTFKDQYPRREADNEMEDRPVTHSRQEGTTKGVHAEAQAKLNPGGVVGAKYIKDKGKGEQTTFDSPIELKSETMHPDCAYWEFGFNDSIRNEKDRQVKWKGFSFSLESDTPLNNPRMWFFVAFEKDKKRKLGALTNVHRYTLICKDTVEEQEETVEFPLAYRMNSRENLGIALEDNSPPVTRRVLSWVPSNSGPPTTENKPSGHPEEENRGEGEKLEEREENKGENE